MTYKGKKETIPGKIISNVDYADGMALIANTPTPAESLQHSLERATRGIDFHMNINKTELVFFNEKESPSFKKVVLLI